MTICGHPKRSFVGDCFWSIPEVDFEEISATLPTVTLQVSLSGVEKAVPKGDSHLTG